MLLKFSSNPTRNNLRVDVPLTNMSIGYKNMTYIADDIFVMSPSQVRSGIVPKYDQSHWFRDAASLRAPGTKSTGGGWKTDISDTFYCHRYSFRYEYDDDTAGEQMSPFNLDRDGVEFVTDKMQLKREVDFSTNFFTSGVWGTTNTLSGTDQWDDYSGSDPLGNIETAKDTIEGATAVEPNALTMGKQVWMKLKWHPDIIDTIKHTQRAITTPDIFSSLTEIPKILIGRSIYTTTVEGTAEGSVSYTRIWGKKALLTFSPPTPALKSPACGYTYVWNRVENALQWIKRMRNEEREVTIIEGNSYFDQKSLATSSGYIFDTVVS